MHLDVSGAERKGLRLRLVEGQLYTGSLNQPFFFGMKLTEGIFHKQLSHASRGPVVSA